MSFFEKIRKRIVLLLVNHIFVGTHMYPIKRKLLNSLPYVTVEKGARIVGPIIFYGTLCIGADTFIGRDFNIEGNGNVQIGDRCDFAPHVCLITGSHEIGNKERRAGKGFSGSIRIGNGSWIGSRVTILPNVSVGDGSIVGAGAIVVNSFQDDCMIAGVPAKIKKEL